MLANLIGTIRDRAILDVGTGTGRAALLLARGGANVTAWTRRSEMLAVARRRATEEGASIRFLVGDAHALEFPDRSFDVAVSLRVLMHTPQWRQCIGELCRVAGRLVIVDYPSAHSVAAIESTARRVAHAAGFETEPYRVFTDRDDRGCLRQPRLPGPLGAPAVRAADRVSQGDRVPALHDGRPRRCSTAPACSRFWSPVTLVAERCASS